MLFVDLVNQDFQNKNTTTKNNFSDPLKIKKIVFTSYKTWIFIAKTVKNIQVTRFQKNKFWFQKIKSKENQNAICLTERTFIHEIKDKYGLESELEIYPQFFTDWCYKRTWRLIAWSVEKVLKIQIEIFLKQKMVD